MQRRLAAIVHADIAGFTRMMEGSETRTFRHLKTAQIEVWRPAIQAANGRLVGTAGDAMLAEFGSAVTAVSAALDIQERMAKFNDTIEPESVMFSSPIRFSISARVAGGAVSIAGRSTRSTMRSNPSENPVAGTSDPRNRPIIPS